MSCQPVRALTRTLRSAPVALTRPDQQSQEPESKEELELALTLEPEPEPEPELELEPEPELKMPASPAMEAPSPPRLGVASDDTKVYDRDRLKHTHTSRPP